MIRMSIITYYFHFHSLRFIICSCVLCSKSDVTYKNPPQSLLVFVPFWNESKLQFLLLFFRYILLPICFAWDTHFWPILIVCPPTSLSSVHDPSYKMVILYICTSMLTGLITGDRMMASKLTTTGMNEGILKEIQVKKVLRLL